MMFDLMQTLAVSRKFAYTVALAASVPVLSGGCSSTTKVKPPTAQPSWTEKLGSSVKSGSSKMMAAVTPKPKPAVDPSIPNGTPGPAVFVAMAQASEQSGDMEQAETQYRKALELDGNHLPALLGYAHLEDRRDNFEAATKLYQKALKKHSKESAVHNDLGLCYHRRAMLPQATKELQTAVELQPQRKLYRGNLASVLVEQGQNEEALKQLVVAHGEAVGNYNLGYLLTQRHNNAAALPYFRKAAEKDPTLAAAQQWIAQINYGRGGVGGADGAPLLASRTTADNRGLALTRTPQVTTNATFVSPPAGTAPSATQTVQTSGVGSSGEYPAVLERRSVQFPDARREEVSSEAIPPLPDQAPGDGRTQEVPPLDG